MRAMKAMKAARLASLFAVAAACAANAAGPGPAALSEREAAAVRDLVAQAMKARGYPSLSVGVVKGGRLIWHEGHGPGVDRATVFRAGSITKVFTATAVLQLRDAGRLKLDDPAATYLPELAPVLSPPGGAPVRIVHLISHTSGVPTLGDGSLDWTRGDHAIAEAELLASVARAKLAFTPGSRTEYSNVGMALAGLIVARVAAQPYRDYVATHLLRPLGMSASAWDREAVPPSRLAAGHWRTGDGRYQPAGPHWRLGAAEPAGGLYISLDDLARFAAFALGHGPAGVLGDGSRREGQRPLVAAAEGYHHGAGWVVQEVPSLGTLVWHNGSTMDYGAWLGLLPDRDLAFIALAGSGDDADVSALASLGRSVLGTLANGPLAVSPTFASEPTPRAAIDAVAGRLLGLLAAPEAGALARTFSAAFLQAVPAEKVLPVFQAVRAQAGRCTGHRVVHDEGRGHLRLEIACERGKVNADLTIDLAPGYLIDGLLLSPGAP